VSTNCNPEEADKDRDSGKVRAFISMDAGKVVEALRML
jgi:hypothetical protein